NLRCFAVFAAQHDESSKLSPLASASKTSRCAHRARCLPLRFFLPDAVHASRRVTERRLFQLRPMVGRALGRRAKFSAQRSADGVLHAHVAAKKRLASVSLE